MLSGRDEIITRTFRRRGSQNRGRDLKESVLHHRLTDSRDNIAAEDDVLLHGRISQIKITILQTLKFVCLTAAVDFKRKLVIPASAKNFDLFRDDFNFSGILLRIGIGAGTNRTLHRDGGLLVDPLHLGNQILVFNDNLRRTIEITYNNKSKVAADHAYIFHPAGNLHLLPDMFQPKLITGMCSVLHHVSFPLIYSFHRLSAHCF